MNHPLAILSRTLSAAGVALQHCPILPIEKSQLYYNQKYEFQDSTKFDNSILTTAESMMEAGMIEMRIANEIEEYANIYNKQFKNTGGPEYKRLTERFILLNRKVKDFLGQLDNANVSV